LDVAGIGITSNLISINNYKSRRLHNTIFFSQILLLLCIYKDVILILENLFCSSAVRTCLCCEKIFYTSFLFLRNNLKINLWLLCCCSLLTSTSAYRTCYIIKLAVLELLGLAFVPVLNWTIVYCDTAVYLSSLAAVWACVVLTGNVAVLLTY
jgi:hypothetical protein